ncbi:MAG: hypothetical protein JST84_01335 [Acidobacteria bacterium]|nr:hypothetical protein [Acidobacteriota bacterium]
MRVTNWHFPQAPEAVARRAGGRRRFNAERQRRAENRRVLVEWRFLQVAEEFLLSRKNPRGWQTRLADELGVSRMQIGRDFKRLLAEDDVLRYLAFLFDCAISFSRLPKRLGLGW